MPHRLNHLRRLKVMYLPFRTVWTFHGQRTCRPVYSYTCMSLLDIPIWTHLCSYSSTALLGQLSNRFSPSGFVLLNCFKIVSKINDMLLYPKRVNLPRSIGAVTFRLTNTWFILGKHQGHLVWIRHKVYLLRLRKQLADACDPPLKPRPPPLRAIFAFSTVRYAPLSAQLVWKLLCGKS